MWYANGMDALASLTDVVLNLPLLAILAGIVIVVVWVNAFFIVYHLTRFGIGPRPKLLAFIFMVGAVVLFTGFVHAASTVSLPDLVGTLRAYVHNVSIPTISP